MSKKRPPFTIVETAVIHSEQLTWSEKRVYIALKSFRRNSPPTQCKPGQDKIMQRARINKQTYLKARDKLKIYGLIKFESPWSEKTGAGPGRGKTINYIFPFEDGTEEEKQRLLAFLKVKKNGTKLNRFRRKKTVPNGTVLSKKNGTDLHHKTVRTNVRKNTPSTNVTTDKKVLTRSIKQQQQGKTKKPDAVASLSHEKEKKPKPVVKDNNSTTSLIAKLRELGITEDKTKVLLANHLYENVEKQVEWLPYRENIKNPAGALIRAVEQNWPEPVTTRAGYWESQKAMLRVAKEDLKKGAGPGRLKEWLDKLDPEYHEELKKFVRRLNS